MMIFVLKAWRVMVLSLVLMLVGCQTGVFMPSPNLYVNSSTNPFDKVPAELKSTEVEIVYATDRLPVQEKKTGLLGYGRQRSGYLSCGVSSVSFGKELDWPELVQQSLATKRHHPLHTQVTGNEELFRFPDTSLYAKANAEGSAKTGEPERSEKEATRQLHLLIHERFAHAQGRDVYVFIHGYNVPFDDAITTMAQLWHFLGRVGVPIVYTWPASGGGGGYIRAYTSDLESGEFTIWHLKRFLTSLASSPDIKRIHVITHSRGGNIALTALRELHLFYQGTGVETQQVLKLGNVICAAPDLDFEVATQRILPEGLLAVPSRLTVYISKKDRAMGFTTWFFGGLARFGKLTFGMLTPNERRRLETVPSFDLIDARIKRADWSGHSYFYQSPAVSSDIILILRDDLDPGKENGRPLRKGPPHYWIIDDNYPQFDSGKGNGPQAINLSPVLSDYSKTGR